MTAVFGRNEANAVEFNITKDKIILFDGAMGTMIQKLGLKNDTMPEMLNLTAPNELCSLHELYLEAGSDVVSANTFSINRFKTQNCGESVETLVKAGVANAKRAAAKYEKRYAALDIGPCGRILKPAGDLDFEEAVDVFAEVVRAGKEADLIILETFTDLYELKAAVIAAKENSDLPVIASMSFEENGHSFFGATVETMIKTLEDMGIQAIGLNCSLGPVQLAPLVDRFLACSTLPVIVQPNAGLPVIRGGKTVFDVTKEDFAETVAEFARKGAAIVGGCCGTTPEYIKLLKNNLKGIKPSENKVHRFTAVCSASRLTAADGTLKIIGERLNPTGKKRLRQALSENDFPYLLKEAVRQQEQGAALLDVNVGLPEINEREMLANVVKEVQAVTDLPLQLDSSNAEVLERAARIYNGKPLINSVNGKKESLETILPIVKKYGCAVLGLTLDENGIPNSAEERADIAGRIIEAAERCGIPRENVLIDCLVMTVSAQQKQAAETLKAIKLVKERYGVKTVLGISNISFGLPARKFVNETMLSLAVKNGLDFAIYNPAEVRLEENEKAKAALLGEDKDCEAYIAEYSDWKAEETKAEATAGGLQYSVLHGLKEEAKADADKLLSEIPPLDVVEKHIVPALDKVGKMYETGRLFLPQLIKAAEAAKYACDSVKDKLPTGNGETDKKIVLATVKGDIHDIGKNIAKVILENYGYKAIDLGKDVAPEQVCEAAKKYCVQLIGLSALMTTTVENMKRTIDLLRRDCPNTKIMVGGAVLTEKLAGEIGADFYASDAMADVRIAEKIFAEH